MGKSKSITIGYWYYPAFLHGLCKGPIDAFLEVRGAEKTAWSGELTASGAISINNPNLWGGEKDQGGMVGTLRVMMGETDQERNAYLTSTFGPKMTSWRGFCTVAWEGGKYGAMNPWPQTLSYKIRTIKAIWDDGECWYPDKAEIAVVPADPGSGSKVEFEYEGGEAFPTVVNVDLGYRTGPVLFEYLTGEIPDKFTVEFDGVEVMNTGYVGDPDHPSSEGGTEQEALDAELISRGLPPEPIRMFNPAYEGTLDLDTDAGVMQERFWKGSSASTATLRVYGPLPLTGWSCRFWSPGANAKPGLTTMNPAHILVFSRTQLELGREPLANINAASAQAAADWYYSRGFGLCTKRPGATESPAALERRICRVAGCSFTRSVTDGQWYIDVANGQYDLESLPILTDGDVLEFKEIPAVFDGAVNSVSVRYFDVIAKQHKTTPPVRAMGLVAAFGLIHKTYEYPEIADGRTATRVAVRELTDSTSLKSVLELVTTRVSYGWRPNQYARLKLPKRGIPDAVVLVAELQHGQLKSGAIRLRVTQEPSELQDAVYVQPEPGVDTRPSDYPEVVDTQLAVETPFVVLAGALSRTELAALPDDAGYVMAVAAAPESEIDYTMAVDAGDGYAEVGTGEWCATATVVESDIGPLDTDLTLAAGTGLERVVTGMGVIWDDEWCRVDAFNAGTNVITLARGCADTVPTGDHEAGSRLWFYETGLAHDQTEYVDGEGIQVKLLSRTGSQQAPVEAATPMALAFDGRQARPYPPGRFQINGEDYPDQVFEDVTVTWAHRDRGLQADQLVDTSVASIGPESGVTYQVDFYLNDVLDDSRTGIAGTSAVWTPSGPGTARVELFSVREGLESWQRHMHEFVAGASLWTPAELTVAPIVWLRDDSPVTDAGSGACSSWEDLSATAAHFVQSSGTQRPQIVPAGLNGRRVIRFDGGSDVLVCTVPALLSALNNVAGAWSMIVYSKTPNASTNSTLLAFRVGGTTNSRLVIQSAFGAANKPALIARRLDADSTASLSSAGAHSGSPTMMLCRMDWSTGAGYVDIDGDADSSNPALTSSGNTSATNSASPVSLGAFATGAATATNFSATDIAEVIVGVGAMPSAGEIDKLFGYLAHRWGLAANLPVGHPYKDDPPTV